MVGPFAVAGGSIAGRGHLAAGRNNQDAWATARSEHCLAAVVCDGCSSGQHSEVGAQLGARLIADAIARRYQPASAIDDLLENVRQQVAALLASLATALAAPRDAAGDQLAGGRAPGWRDVVTEHFLFTAVGVVVTSEVAQCFALGDGLVVLNGERWQLGPYANNEPPYLGYCLLGAGGNLDLRAGPRFELGPALPTSELRHALIGTDGAIDLEQAAERVLDDESGAAVGPLAQFWSDPLFVRNRDAIRRRLSVLNRPGHPGLLPDDTTLVLLRRPAAEASC